MKKFATFAFATVVACVAPQIAQAVDLVNEDDADHIVMILENGEETGVTVSAGESITDVCNSCTLSIGDNDNEPVSAEGDETIVVRNGLLTKRSG